MTIIPSARCICPSCFEEINLGKCDIVSGVTTGRVLKYASSFKWKPSRVFIEPLDGPIYAQELARRRCPECKYLLPYNIEQVRSIILSVAGDVYSGKSTYIASLIPQLKKWSRSVKLRCLTPDIEKEFILSHLTHLDSNMSVPATQPAFISGNPLPLVDHPLIYKVTVNFRRVPNTFNLMIYDTSGEDYRQIDRLVRFARFALNSSAFIFVADPFTMDPVYRALPANLKTMIPTYAQPDKRRPASEVLNDVVDVFRQYHREPDTARLADVPIAVMVSKADIFTQAIDPPYSYHYNGFAPSYRPDYDLGVDMEDIEEINREVINLLANYQQNSLLGNASNLKNIKFFATSATGVPPDKTDHFPSINPWRCLDPMLWILFQLGIIRRKQ